MKRKTRMTGILGFIVAVIMTAYTGPAIADDGSPSYEGSPISPHPCARLRTAITSHDIAEEELGQAEDRLTDRRNEWRDERDAYEDFFLDIISEIPGTEWAWGFMPLDCFVEDPSSGDDFYVTLGPCVIKRLQEIIQERRDAGDHEGAADAERLLEDLESRYEDLVSAYEAWDRAKTELDEAEIEEENRRLAEADARRECNLTRVQGSLADMWAVHIVPIPERPLVNQMANPMGSNESQPNNDNDSLTSVTYLGQGQGTPPDDGQTAAPQFEATTGTLPPAQVFDKVTENQGTDNNQPSSPVTAEVMLPEQPEDANGGKDAIGRTPMLVPPDPETNTTVEAAASDRLFESVSNVLRAQVEQSDSSAAANAPQVQQNGNSNQGNNPMAYTHMPIPRATIQSSEAVAPRKIPRVRRLRRSMRVFPGHLRKR